MADGEGNESGKDLRERFESQLAEMKQANEDANKQATDAAQRADQAERKLAFAEAGIDLSDAKAQYFVKGYDGELESDKIKAKWTEVFGEQQGGQSQHHPDPASQPNQPLQSEYGELTAMNQATSGTPVSNQKQSDATLIEGMDRVLRDGGTVEQLAAFMDANGLPVAEGYRRR